MTTHPQKERLTFYPVHYFGESPTANRWAKLTALGVHALRPPPNTGTDVMHSSAETPSSTHSSLILPVCSLLDCSNYISSIKTGNGNSRIPTLYHLNHPISYVRLIGTVVALDAPTPTFALLTLDDGSGATIEVKIRRLKPDQLDQTGTHASNTTIPNVDVKTSNGDFDAFVDGDVVDMGTVINVKATLDFFRGVTQLLMVRCSVVKSTAEEVRGWAETAKYMRETLARPWELSAKMQAKLDQLYKQEQEREAKYKMKKERRQQARERARAEWGRLREEQDRKLEERRERRREREEILMNRGALV
ncbi:hypothetical protein IWZ00DRAFT_543157 [Phyllosticta capitalensis]|uniref:CST complex subunit Stn1 N-terminal domain-containing protein n=1 Tax=Phyllosticta capitalensis TaxID=121624 RepID=A0ABR1YSG0_9PEZI